MLFLAASILRPYISEKNYWILQHHEVTKTIKCDLAFDNVKLTN